MLELRDYQVTGAEQARDLILKYGAAYFAWEPRVGKTLTALRTCELIYARKVLMLTTKKAIKSIEADARNYAPPFELKVSNYEANDWHEFDPDVYVLDEAHRLGQFPILAHKVKKLRKMTEGKPIIYCSGTPTPESYSQIYHQLFLMGELSPFAKYGNFYSFANDWVTIQEKMYNGITHKDYQKCNPKVFDRYSHLLLTKTQAEAGIEQMVNEHVHTVTMNEATYFTINLLREKRVVTGRNGKLIADSAGKLMGKIHQMCSGTVIFDEGEFSGSIFDRTKAIYIRDHFAGKKIAIYYKFQNEKVMLQTVFGAERLTESPEEFNYRDDKIFIAQFQSGREGVNLSTADALVAMNIDFSAVSYWQFRARLQSKERTKSADLHWIFAKDGIEPKIYERVMNKKTYTVRYFIKDYQI